MSARDAIATAIKTRHENSSDADVAAQAITILEGAGYVILSPDEVRGIRDEALEEAAVKAFQVSQHVRADADDVAAAIRSLKGGRDA